MVYKSKNSRILKKAQARLTGFQSVESKKDLGFGLTTDGYSALIKDLETSLSEYNQMVIQANAMRSQIASKERKVSEYSQKILMGVGIVYGKDSLEYEWVGGTRRS